MTTKKVKAEALEILTAPGARYDPFAPSVKLPDVLLQIVKGVLDDFVSKNPQPSGQSPEELADAFLHHMAERTAERKKKAGAG